MSETPAAESNGAELTALDKKIIRQIEYYFGDANLAKDKFMKEQIAKDDGWIPLSVLLTFNRLKAMSEDADAIIESVNKSAEGLVETRKEPEAAIRRHPTRPIPAEDEESRKTIQDKLVYAKGFPTELTLDDLIDFFEPLGSASVQLRFTGQRKFKGSVFVLFATVEKAAEFVKAEEIKYKDSVISPRMYKHEYFTMKNKDKDNLKAAEVERKEKLKLQKEKEEQEEFEKRMTKGALLKVTGLTKEAEMNAIKEFFSKFEKVAWVDQEDDHTMVRFAAESSAKAAWQKAVDEAEDGKVKLGEAELQATVIEGDEEEAHWKEVFASMKSASQFSRRGGRGGGRGGRGRGGFGGKRRGGRNEGGSGGKRAKAE